MNRSLGEGMPIATKRVAGEIMGRKEIAERIIGLATIASGASYKDAMHIAGKIYCLVVASSYDDYWTEKIFYGIRAEEYNMEHIISRFEIEKKQKNGEIA